MTSTRESAKGLVKVLTQTLPLSPNPVYGDQTEIIYQRRRKGGKKIKEKFCPYIGIKGTKVDLHSSKLYPGLDHVGVKPAQSLGTITTGGIQG